MSTAYAYTEGGTAPGVPLPGGDVGGDGQSSDAWTRWFWRPLDDGRYAVITTYYYVDDPVLRTGDPNAGRPVLTRHTEFSVCRDLTDIGGTEEASDHTFVELPSLAATDEMAHHLCVALTADAYTWDGASPIRLRQTA